MSAADKLTKLMEGATPGPCQHIRIEPKNSTDGFYAPYSPWVSGSFPRAVSVHRSLCIHADDHALITYLRNNAEAIRDLIVAAEKIERIGCMGGDGEIWCKGDSHSIYCPAGIAKNALAKIQP